MKQLLTYSLFIIPIFTFSQSAEDDEITYRAALDWLDRKLNYYYYDETVQKWWLNQFYVNEKKEVTIKNISTNKPQTAYINEKVYLIRKFNIQDINPQNINVREIEKSQGRIAKGKLLELRTFGNQKKISKTVDGRRATTTSFVHISFPTFMTDSIADYAELVKGKLKDAIIASTKIYATGSSYDDRKQIFEIIEGDFESSGGEVLTARKQMSNVYDVSLDTSSKNYFGYDEAKALFYLTKITSSGVITLYYKQIAGEKLTLQNVNQASDLIGFETKNTLRLNGKTYFRQ